MVLGGTGTAGQATVRALVRRGHDVVCFVRPQAGVRGKLTSSASSSLLTGATLRFGSVSNQKSLVQDGFCGEPFDALMSCLSTRTGAPKDAWDIDYAAHISALHAARNAGVKHFVLLSALCVQRPLLAFQQAKLAFERVLIDSGVPYSIVRPTAFFKSLAGQVARVKRGKPFLVFGDGKLTSCKPISDNDLASFLADCLDREDCRNRVLPIGGPGAAITPIEQGEQLFALVGRAPRFRHVPVALLDGIVHGMSYASAVIPSLADRAEFARIVRYYATQSMLVLDATTGRYDAAATPSTGSETLTDYYARLIEDPSLLDQGDHAVFEHT